MTSNAESGESAGRDGRRAAAWVAAGILASRMAGLARDVLFAFFFGNSAFAEAWRAALRIPNVVQNLLGEGTLSASFVPIYAELLERGELERAGRFAGAAFGILTAVAGLLALLGASLAPLLVTVFAPGFDGQTRELTVQLVRILFPMTGVLVLSAWALGILNSHRRFFVSYVAPVVWNAAMIATMIALGWIWAFEGDDLIVALGWGALAGGVLQFGVQLPFLAGRLRYFRPSLDLGVPGIREAIRNFVPVVSARGIVNLSALVELQLASFLAAGAVAVLGYAQRLYILPISLFGLAVAAAELPELSRQRERDREVGAEGGDLASQLGALEQVPMTAGVDAGVGLGRVATGVAGCFGSFPNVSLRRRAVRFPGGRLSRYLGARSGSGITSDGQRCGRGPSCRPMRAGTACHDSFRDEHVGHCPVFRERIRRYETHARDHGLSGANELLELEPLPFKLFDLRQFSRDILLDDTSQVVQVTDVLLHAGNGVPDRFRKPHEFRLVLADRLDLSVHVECMLVHCV